MFSTRRLRAGCRGNRPVRLWAVASMIAAMAGGVGVVVYVLAGYSLQLAAGTVFIVAATVAVVAIGRLSGAQRRLALTRIKQGAVAGLAATAAYDLARFGLASALGVSPFEVWAVFGRLLVGDQASRPLVMAAGTAYHLGNGIGFAIAFAMFTRRPTWWKGVGFAMGLEAAMAFLYPNWLRIEQLAEFYTVSVAGHFVYGSVLGTSLAALKRRQPTGWLP